MGRIQTGRFWMICSILAAMLSGCSFGDEPSVCPYNVRMEYWYAGSSTENTLPTYVDNLRQYLFDAKGNLLATITLKGDSVAGWNGNLPTAIIHWFSGGTSRTKAMPTKRYKFKMKTI